MINYAVQRGHPKNLEDVKSLVPTTCFVAIVSNVEDEEFNLIMDAIMTLPAYPYAIFLIQGDRIQLNITRSWRTPPIVRFFQYAFRVLEHNTFLGENRLKQKVIEINVRATLSWRGLYNKKTCCVQKKDKPGL